MPLLSDIAQKKKIDYFFRNLPRDARILEVGSGSGWVGEWLRENGFIHHTGLDISPPAQVVGDINQWQQLGLAAESFDVIVAFEVVEHVDCFQACHDLLKPGGKLLLTSPVPHFDWFMAFLEKTGLNQKRTSPHDHLVYFKHVSQFTDKQIRVIAFLSQWGIFTK
ncbi:MAG: class I SAM-dependent methyltransferase [Magnetococcales bacterium]|nr:class I SAM-dependent methyltransferase [Magnetococcales bacterium]